MYFNICTDNCHIHSQFLTWPVESHVLFLHVVLLLEYNRLTFKWRNDENSAPSDEGPRARESSGLGLIYQHNRANLSRHIGPGRAGPHWQGSNDWGGENNHHRSMRTAMGRLWPHAPLVIVICGQSGVDCRAPWVSFLSDVWKEKHRGINSEGG